MKVNGRKEAWAGFLVKSLTAASLWSSLIPSFSHFFKVGSFRRWLRRAHADRSFAPLLTFCRFSEGFSRVIFSEVLTFCKGHVVIVSENPSSVRWISAIFESFGRGSSDSEDFLREDNVDKCVFNAAYHGR